MRVQPVLIGSMFLLTGARHFVTPGTFAEIVPPGLPAPRTLVAISGVAELLGGLGVFPAATRRAAGIGLIALLVAVFPANVYMAMASQKFAALVPAWALWVRLPLQPLAMWWVWRAAIVPPAA